MKYLGTFLVGLVLGGGLAWYMTAKSTTIANQLHYMAEMDSTIKYIEALDDGQSETVRKALRTKLACGAQAFEELLQAPFWEENGMSDALLVKSKDLTRGVRCSG